MLRFDFCGDCGQFTPIYHPEPDANTASVNAGDYNLYVGGGAINRAFAELLKLKPNNAYQHLHTSLLKKAEAEPGRLVTAEGSEIGPAGAKLGVAGSFARVPGDGAPQRGPVCAAFVDIFEPASRPLSSKNVAMLYVVGPKGQGATGGHGPTMADEVGFLQAVEDMGANALLAVCEYNGLVAAAGRSSRAALPKIEVVQWCLVSGGVYRHPRTSKLHVAMATVRGLLAAASHHSVRDAEDCPIVRFAYDEAVFEQAVQLVTKASQGNGRL